MYNIKNASYSESDYYDNLDEVNWIEAKISSRLSWANS